MQLVIAPEIAELLNTAISKCTSGVPVTFLAAVEIGMHQLHVYFVSFVLFKFTEGISMVLCRSFMSMPSPRLSVPPLAKEPQASPIMLLNAQNYWLRVEIITPC